MYVVVPQRWRGPLRSALMAALSLRLKTGVRQEDVATLCGFMIQYKFYFLPVTSLCQKKKKNAKAEHVNV